MPDTSASSSAPAGCEPAIGGAPGASPTITIPDCAPPAELQTKDIVVGDGAEVHLGDTITVHYIGASWSTKQTFDASWSRGAPATFELTFPGLIEGWAKGIPGMKIGGRRLLVIPPALGYGPQGRPPAIPANETLVFVVDVRQIGTEGK